MRRRRGIMGLNGGAGIPVIAATASGNPLTFETDLARPLKSLVIPFTPIQAAGTPSPDNPLPISGWTGVNVYNRLPPEYQEVDYLTGNGNQYIDSGIECTSDLAVDFSFSSTSSENKAVCGGIIQLSNSIFRHHCTPEHTGTPVNFYWIQNSSVSQSSVQFLFTTGKKYDVYINPVTGRSVVNGNESAFTPLSSGLTTGKNYGIFGRIFSTGEIQAKPSTFYYFKFYRNDILIGDFVPCYRKSDNKPGMYDLISRTFFTNQGTGEFTVGSDVNRSQTISITFTDPTTGDPMTVYGGTLTLNEDGSADLVSEFVQRDISEMNIQEPSSSGEPWNHRFIIRKWGYTPVSTWEQNYGKGLLATMFRNGNGSTNGTFLVPQGYFYDNTISTVAEFREKYAGMKLCYGLKNEFATSYHFNNIGQLVTFRGTNTIWTDTNGTNTATYLKHQS